LLITHRGLSDQLTTTRATSSGTQRQQRRQRAVLAPTKGSSGNGSRRRQHQQQLAASTMAAGSGDGFGSDGQRQSPVFCSTLQTLLTSEHTQYFNTSSSSSNVLFQNTHTLLIHFSKLKHYTIFKICSLTASITLIVVVVVDVVAGSNMAEAEAS